MMAGEERVHFTADDDTVRTMRQAFTSVAAVDPFVRVAAGRSAFHVSDLLALSALLAGLDGDARDGNEGDGDTDSVKEIMSHV